MIKNYEKILFCFYVVALHGIIDETFSLPQLTKKEIVGGYLQHEVWKGLGVSTLGLGLGAASMRFFSRRYPSFKAFEWLKNKNTRKYAIGLLLYGLPQVFNLLKYNKLTKTNDVFLFRVKGNREDISKKVTDTKFYMQPNPLKILARRLMSIKNNETESSEIYKQLVKHLLPENIIELIHYLQEYKKEVNVDNKINNIVKGIFNYISTNVIKIINKKSNTFDVDPEKIFKLCHILDEDTKKSIIEVINDSDEYQMNILEMENLQNFYSFIASNENKELFMKLFEKSLTLLSSEEKLYNQEQLNKDRIIRSLLILTMLFKDETLSFDVPCVKLAMQLCEKIKVLNLTFDQVFSYFQTYFAIIGINFLYAKELDKELDHVWFINIIILGLGCQKIYPYLLIYCLNNISDECFKKNKSFFIVLIKKYIEMTNDNIITAVADYAYDESLKAFNKFHERWRQFVENLR